MVDSSLYPIAILIDELKSDDVKKRINSVKNLHTIATALGPERTRKELLPYILDLLDDEEEVLTSLADSLGAFLDYVGGPANAVHVLHPLENLCAVEEGTVREKATDGIKKIFSALKLKDIETDVMAMIKRLMSNEGFTSKFSATTLIPSIYPNLSSSS